MLNALGQMVVLHIIDSPKMCKGCACEFSFSGWVCLNANYTDYKLFVQCNCLMQLLPNDDITLLCKLNVQSDFV